jgi:histidinol-phosphate aminotransferase
VKFVGVDLTPDFELDEKAMLDAIALHQPAIVYLAYPNNPTANLWNDETIEKIVQAAPGLVVIDEAYQPFSSRTYLDRVVQHEHVLLMRTLSKFGLAGVRIGYMMGPARLVAEVDKLRPPYNISVLNAEAALFALEHEDVFAAQAADLKRERARLQSALREMGLQSWPSDANMILVRVPDPARSFDGMKARKVLVKNVSRMHPLLEGCLRLTVGTPQENTLMIDALKASL